MFDDRRKSNSHHTILSKSLYQIKLKYVISSSQTKKKMRKFSPRIISNEIVLLLFMHLVSVLV